MTPIDGYGIYDSVNPIQGISVWGPRLDQIAQGGFKLVMNYGLLHGHASDVIAYINYAASRGLKIIVELEDPAIWRDHTIALHYPQLYADSGNQATDQGFTTYVVNLVKDLPIWGYYIGDGASPSDHAALKAHADIVKAIDPNHPRLYIDACYSSIAQSIGKNNSIFSDVAEIVGSDYYPVGNPGNPMSDTAIYAANIQTFANRYGLHSAMALQAFDEKTYHPTWQNTSFPIYDQMKQQRDLALANMQPQMLLWFSLRDILNSDNPTEHWNDLCNGINC